MPYLKSKANTYRRMQKDFPYKTVTMQICNKNVTNLSQECINFVQISHRSVNELVTILQQNSIAYATNILLSVLDYQSCYSFAQKSFCIQRLHSHILT